MTAESFWNYYRGKIIGDNDNSTQAETFKCKIKTIGKHQRDLQNLEIQETQIH